MQRDSTNGAHHVIASISIRLGVVTAFGRTLSTSETTISTIVFATMCAARIALR